MSSALTSWKEIAGYLGKGVRTVQRWERDMGLPVRRPHHRNKGLVLALPEDIDSWLQSRYTLNVSAPDSDPQFARLRDELAQLKTENEALRHDLENLAAMVLAATHSDAPLNGASDNSRRHHSRPLDAAARKHQDYAELREMSRNIRAVAALHLNTSAGNGIAFQPELSLVSRLCAAAETGLAQGNLAEARKLVVALRRNCEEIRSRVDGPSHLPEEVRLGLRRQLAQFESRILSIQVRCSSAAS
jgi:hypothetical protein